MTFEEWYADFSKFWGSSTKQDVAQCMDVIQAAYKAGMLRAAEIAEDVEEGCGYGCPNIIADAIRKEIINDR